MGFKQKRNRLSRMLMLLAVAVISAFPTIYAKAATTELFETSNNIEYSGLIINGGQFAGIDSMNNVTGTFYPSSSSPLMADGSIAHGVVFGVTNNSSLAVHYTNAGTYNGRNIDMYISVDGIQTVNRYNAWNSRYTAEVADRLKSKVGSRYFVHFMTDMNRSWELNWNGGVATARYTFSFAYSDDSSHTKINIPNAYMSCHNLVEDGGGNEFASPGHGWRGHAFKRETDKITIGTLCGMQAWYGTSANDGYENVTFDFNGTNIGIVIGDTVGWIGYSFDFAPLKSVYQVKYDKNSESASGAMSEQAMVVDRSYNLTANSFTRTGYDWTGWNSASDGSGTAYSDKQSVTNLTTTNGGTYTMYAQWAPHTYKIRFHKNADDATGTMDDMDMTYDEEKNLTKVGFQRAGYTFHSWHRDNKTDESNTYEDEDIVENLSDVDGDVVDLYAEWEPIPYVIRYDRNGGSGTMQDQPMSYGVAANLLPNAFTRSGYDFAGWRFEDKDAGKQYADKASVNNLTTESDKTVTMYAQWTPHKYTIKFDKNKADATGTTDSMDMTFDVEKSLTTNGFSSPSSTFSGWNTKPDGTGTSYKDGASVMNLTDKDGDTVTLYAVWGDKRFTVTFVDGISNTTITSVKVIYGHDATPPTAPYHKGYKSDGWDGKYTNVTEDRTVTVRYSPIAYTIRFDGNGSTGGSTPAQQMRFDETQPLNANGFKRDGYVFAGWKLGDKKSGTSYADKASVTNLTDTDGTSVTMYAQWTANGYTIKYNANGGTGTMSDQGMTYDVAERLYANAFKRDGYTFTGWKRDDARSGKAYAPREEVKNLLTSGTTTMYAQWKANSYTVTIIDGLSGATIGTQTVTYGSDATEPSVPKHDGYTFTSWDNKFTNITSDRTITAQYRLNKYTIKFDGNADNVKGTTASMSMEFNKPAALTKNGFTRTGYDWIGWAANKDGSGTSYSDGQTVTNLSVDDGATVTLYAVWRKQLRTVTFIDGFDKTVISRVDIEYGSNAMAPAMPSHKGYTPTGWDKNATNITENTTITLGYAPISYKVRFNGNSKDASGMMDMQSMTYDKESTLNKNVFKRPGYHFAGWNLSSDGMGGSFRDQQKVRNLSDTDGDIVDLYAIWVEDGHVLITYSVDVPNVGNEVSRGSESLNPVTGVAEGSEAIPGDAYNFKTWSDESGADISEQNDYIPTMPTDGWVNASYIANFEIKKHNVRFVDGVSNENIKTEIIDHGKSATAPDAPTHDGYEFIGWDKEFDNITEDTVITAQYREIKKEAEPEPVPEPPAVTPEPKAPAQSDVASDLVQTGVDITKSVIALMASAVSIVAMAIIRKRQ